MPWNFRFNKRQFATVKPNWQHTAPQIRALMEKQPPGSDRKFLECLLYLRLGYKMAQVADMTKLESSTIRQHVKTYNKSGLKDYEPKVEKPKVEKSVQVAEKPLPRKKPSFKIGVTPRQGTLAFLRIGYTLYDGGKEKRTSDERKVPERSG